MCTLCRANGYGLPPINQHIAHIHMGLVPNSHACHCGSTYESEVQLTHHIRSAHIIILYVCNVCGMRFNEGHQLYRHYRDYPSHGYVEVN